MVNGQANEQDFDDEEEEAQDPWKMQITGTYYSPTGKRDRYAVAYLLLNTRLQLLKVGSGQLGRVQQYFRSQSSDGSKNFGGDWRLLIAVDFGHMFHAQAAERAVLDYWHRHLGLKAAAAPGAFGVAPIHQTVKILYMRTSLETFMPLSGESETVRAADVCHHCSAMILKGSEGFARVVKLDVPKERSVRINCTNLRGFDGGHIERHKSRPALLQARAKALSERDDRCMTPGCSGSCAMNVGVCNGCQSKSRKHWREYGWRNPVLCITPRCRREIAHESLWGYCAVHRELIPLRRRESLDRRRTKGSPFD